MVQWEEQVLESKGPRFKFFEPLSLFLCRKRENTRATVLSDWKEGPSIGLINGHDYSKYAWPFILFYPRTHGLKLP